MATSTSNGTQHMSEMEGHVNDGFSPDMKVVNEKGTPDSQEPLPARLSSGEERLPDKLELPLSEKWRILKNIAAVSCSFMILFTAFQGTANLQSSINAKDGLGTVSLCTIYAALVVSSIFVPTFVIKRLTVKWTLCFSMLCYIPYIACQFYPRFYTLVPAGVILGIGAAPMWAAKATYLTQVGGIYAKLTDQAVDGIIVRFFGFFFLAWQTSELWGNLISSLGKPTLYVDCLCEKCFVMLLKVDQYANDYITIGHFRIYSTIFCFGHTTVHDKSVSENNVNIILKKMSEGRAQTQSNGANGSQNP